MLTAPEGFSTPVESRVEIYISPANCMVFLPAGSCRTRGEGCYARRLPAPDRSMSTLVQQPSGSSADHLWNDVSGRLQEQLSDTTYATWFGPAVPGGLRDDEFVVVLPNEFTRGWIESHFLPLLRGAVCGALGRDVRVRLDVAEEDESPVPTAAEPEAPGPRVAAEAQPGSNPKYTFDNFVIGSSNRFAHAAALAVAECPGTGLQPALRLRRHRSRQDPPAPGDRRLRERPLQGDDDALRHERDVHERLHQLAAGQADRGLQAPLPRLRRAPRRRHPVPRGEGALPGGVLPHLQLPLRGRAPDRDLVRPAAEGDRHARGAAALPVRVGAHHGHPAARPRDAHRDPAEEGDDRPDRGHRPRGA